MLRFLLVVVFCNCWDLEVFVSAPLRPPSFDLELCTTLLLAPSLPRNDKDAVDFFVSVANFPDPVWSCVMSLVLDFTRLL